MQQSCNPLHNKYNGRFRYGVSHFFFIYVIHCIFARMKYIYLPLGFLCLACGIIGIFVPLLPTTPFLLLSAALFFRSSPRAYHWLLNHRHLGPYIRRFREEHSIPLRAKVVAISLLWITSLHCCFLMLDHWLLKGAMLAVAVGVTIYLLSLRTSSASSDK